MLYVFVVSAPFFGLHLLSVFFPSPFFPFPSLCSVIHVCTHDSSCRGTLYIEVHVCTCIRTLYNVCFMLKM